MLNKLIEFKLLQIFESIVELDDSFINTLKSISSPISDVILDKLEDDMIDTDIDNKGIEKVFKDENDLNYLKIKRLGRDVNPNEKMKLGRFIRTVSSQFKDEEIEKFVHLYKRINDPNFSNIEILHGTEIRKLYDLKCVVSRGELSQSCMRGELDLLGIYEDNPDKINGVALYDSGGKIAARALLWNTDQGDIILDRIYAISEAEATKLMLWAKSKGYKTKNEINDIPYTVTLNKYEYGEKYPSIDTFSYMTMEGVLSNIQPNHDHYIITKRREPMYIKYEIWMSSEILTDYNSIKSFLNECNVKEYKIHDDMSVSISDSTLNMSGKNLQTIPIKIREFFGKSIDLSYNKIKTLEGTYIPNILNCNLIISQCKLENFKGFPLKVLGDLNISGNYLKNLDECPKFIGGDFNATYNKLTRINGKDIEIVGDFIVSHNEIRNLKDSPEKIGGSYYLKHNQVKSLEGMPKTIIGNFMCSNNKLKNLIGCSDEIIGNLLASYNELESLQGFPKSVGGDIFLSYNKLKSLVGLPDTVNKSLDVSNNEIESLKGCPKIINGNFDISDNRIRDLEGSPKYVHGKYDLSDNAVNFSEIDVTYYTEVGYNSISRFWLR